VSIAAGFLLMSPFFLYEVKRILQYVCQMPPRVALSGTVAAGGLFVVGAGFCYLAILPVTLRFLLSFGGENITAGISVSKYLSLISVAFLAQNRRYAVLFAAVVTAIITPTPDAFTMSMLLVPLLALYESSILLLRLAERRAAGQAE
jgi:sec-independent protein translocase protein TatC